MALLDLHDITKSFDDDLVLDRITLSLEKGSILCLLGPSGCGKTTLLRIIAGLETPDSGKIVFDGLDMAGIEPFRRPFGMMFQEFALFPHKNVFGNVAFGLRMQNLSRKDVMARTGEVLAMMGLERLGHRNVAELSGGERQRVALARTLAPRPRLLLLDEPLGALDRALRERLMVELRAILKGISATCVFVTHDQAEAYAMADRIAVIIDGRVEQTDRPERLYRRPGNPAVARFLGLHNLIEGEIAAGGTVMTEFGVLTCVDASHHRSGHVTLLIQPDAARICSAASAEVQPCFRIAGRVSNLLYRGTHHTMEMETPAGTRLRFDLPDEPQGFSCGQSVALIVDPGGVHVIGGPE